MGGPQKISLQTSYLNSEKRRVIALSLALLPGLRKSYIKSKQKRATAFASTLDAKDYRELLSGEVKKLLNDLERGEMSNVWKQILREEWVKRGATEKEEFKRVKV